MFAPERDAGISYMWMLLLSHLLCACCVVLLHTFAVVVHALARLVRLSSLYALPLGALAAAGAAAAAVEYSSAATLLLLLLP
jgi:hypothetical protein